tara:strand:+ start:5941 stop:7185 length:1245 start_codon:yes stop_codon:yes gene_type:complete
MKITIENPVTDDETLEFVISGDREDGLEKSIVNSLRRVLLTEIPCVAFRVDEGKPMDMKMEVNNTSSHNEFLLHRISLIPLYIDPLTYNKDYLFQLQVKLDSREPFLFVTSDMFTIYPLKEDIDVDVNLNDLDINNYDLLKKLSDKEKKEIIRPYVFKGKEYYNLITELKNTYSEDTNFQEISVYGSPSVSNGKEHSRWKGVSDAVYTFTKDDEQFASIAKEKADLKNITDEAERDTFIRSLALSESERYFHRDVDGESYKYDFKLTSLHLLSPKDLFILSNNIMKAKLASLKNNLILMIKGSESSVSVSAHGRAPSTYDIIVPGEDDTLGNVIQSHVVKNFIDDTSLLHTFGYVRSHPLEDHIILTMSINPNHKLYDSKDDVKLSGSVKVLEDAINEISSIYDEIISVSEKLL